MFRITECLSVGPFASPARAEKLLAAGVTHILNVSDEPSEILKSEGAFAGKFAEIAWVPMSDSRRLLHVTAIRALDTLHKLVSVPDSHVYVHCIAGLIRSPTVLWLYLIALGVPAKEGREWIEERSRWADPGSSCMVDSEHVLLAQKHGLANFFPHPRPNLIVPFPFTPSSDEG
jgi:hypothetical protein